MNSLKEKVSEKLSNLLADSPVPSSPREPPEVISHSKGGSSLSSIFSFILPSANFDEDTSDNNQEDLKPLQSLPSRWKTHSPSWRLVGNAPACEEIEPASPQGEYESPFSARSYLTEDMFEDADEPPTPMKLMPNLTEESSLVYLELYEFLSSSLPNIVKGCQWVLLYSTLKHGISLRTLIRNSADLPGPGLLIFGDKRGAVFGGLLDCPLKPTPKRNYQGTNQTFVFTTVYGEPRLFRPTGVNRYYFMCLNDFLGFGGGQFALAVEGDLLTGTSGPCQTFGNDCLAFEPEFELKNVELWGFTHSSRYLN